MSEPNAEHVVPGKASIFAAALRKSEMRFEGPTAEGRYFVGFYNSKGRLWGPMLFVPNDYEVIPEDAPIDGSEATR